MKAAMISTTQSSNTFFSASDGTLAFALMQMNRLPSWEDVEKLLNYALKKFGLDLLKVISSD
jgi:hypothetical protein